MFYVEVLAQDISPNVSCLIAIKGLKETCLSSSPCAESAIHRRELSNGVECLLEVN